MRTTDIPQEWRALVNVMGLDAGEREAVDAVLALIASARAASAPQPPLPPKLQPRKLLTVPETASTLRVGRTTVYALMERDELAWIQVAGKRRISAVEIERYIAAHTRSRSG